MKQKIPLNIPNIISLYRLFAFPVVLFIIIAGNQSVFSILLIISLFSDVLDGWIARKFHMETEIGAKIDSLADIGTYLLAITGVFVFKWEEFSPFRIFFFVFIGLFLLSHIVSILRFRRTPSLHLYSSKTAGYIQGGFFIVLFSLGFYSWYFFVMILSGYFAFTESIAISLISKKYLTNAKGLYWVLKEPTRL